MNLYLADVVTKEKILHVVVHAESAEAAQALLYSKFPRCELQNARELGDTPRHFVVAETSKT